MVENVGRSLNALSMIEAFGLLVQLSYHGGSPAKQAS